MININGKEWHSLEPIDIQTVIGEQDFDESFYFELKDDKVAPKKIMEEVSAFANTFGGYIILGVSDDKKITGCIDWDEQRIHTTMYTSITPTPSFDVRKFTCDSKIIYVIKVDEGSEPPYITNNGKIYERLSSGSFPIKDSVRLLQIYNKRENLLAKMESKVSIPQASQNTNNIYGYIDSGFIFVPLDLQTVCDKFNKIDLKAVAKELSVKTNSFNIAFVGNSIVYTPGGLSTENGKLPAHTNNFLEIMADGSAKMRILLHNNDQNDSTVNMIYARSLLDRYQEVYATIMKDLLPDKMAYAKKYESLTVFRQFQPIVFYDDDILQSHPGLREKNDKVMTRLQECQKVVGTDIVITNDRIPKTGLYTIDKRQMEKWGVPYTAESIIDELFYSRFTTLGSLPFSTSETDDLL